MKKLLLVILLLMFGINLQIINVRAETNLIMTAFESAELLCQNIDYINDYSDDLGFDTNIHSCKLYPLTIYAIDEVLDGYLVDFNGNNGYAVVGPNLVIYNISFNKESINEHTIKSNIVYDVTVGFQYYDQNQTDLITDYEMSSTPIGNPSGPITDVSAYITQHYGTGYDLNEFERVTYATGALQTSLSVYMEILEGGYVSSEGNCGLVSAYNLLLFYRYEDGYYNLPYGYTYRPYDPSSEESDFYDEKHNNGVNYLIYDTEDGNTQRDFSYLYIEARQAAIDIHGSTENLSVWNSRDILNSVMESNNYSTRFKIIELGGFNTAKSRIDDGEGILYSVALDQIYGEHTMMIRGYRIYLKEVPFLFFTLKYYIEFYEIYDGWSTSVRYYDVCFTPLISGFVVKQ